MHLYGCELLRTMGGQCALSASLMFLAAKSSENSRSVDEVVLCFVTFFQSQGSTQEDGNNEVLYMVAA